MPLSLSSSDENEDGEWWLVTFEVRSGGWNLEKYRSLLRNSLSLSLFFNQRILLDHQVIAHATAAAPGWRITNQNHPSRTAFYICAEPFHSFWFCKCKRYACIKYCYRIYRDTGNNSRTVFYHKQQKYQDKPLTTAILVDDVYMPTDSQKFIGYQAHILHEYIWILQWLFICLASLYSSEYRFCIT